MPGPLGPAAVLAGPGAVAAAKHLAFRAATSPSVTSTTLTAVLFYWSFRRLPNWVKDDISFKNLLKNRTDLSKDEFVGLFSVVEKLQKMASNMKDLDIDIPQLHAALLAFIQLSGQNKLKQLKYHRSKGNNRDKAVVDDNPDDTSVCSSSTTSTTPKTSITRDYLYESAGKTLELSSLRSKEIQNGLKMTLFSYYEDPEVCITRIFRRGFTHWESPSNIVPQIAQSDNAATLLFHSHQRY